MGMSSVAQQKQLMLDMGGRRRGELGAGGRLRRRSRGGCERWCAGRQGRTVAQQQWPGPGCGAAAAGGLGCVPAAGQGRQGGSRRARAAPPIPQRKQLVLDMGDAGGVSWACLLYTSRRG